MPLSRGYNKCPFDFGNESPLGLARGRCRAAPAPRISSAGYSQPGGRDTSSATPVPIASSSTSPRTDSLGKEASFRYHSPSRGLHTNQTPSVTRVEITALHGVAEVKGVCDARRGGVVTVLSTLPKLPGALHQTGGAPETSNYLHVSSPGSSRKHHDLIQSRPLRRAIKKSLGLVLFLATLCICSYRS